MYSINRIKKLSKFIWIDIILSTSISLSISKSIIHKSANERGLKELWYKLVQNGDESASYVDKCPEEEFCPIYIVSKTRRRKMKKMKGNAYLQFVKKTNVELG